MCFVLSFIQRGLKSAEKTITVRHGFTPSHAMVDGYTYGFTTGTNLPKRPAALSGCLLSYCNTLSPVISVMPRHFHALNKSLSRSLSVLSGPLSLCPHH